MLNNEDTVIDIPCSRADVAVSTTVIELINVPCSTQATIAIPTSSNTVPLTADEVALYNLDITF